MWVLPIDMSLLFRMCLWGHWNSLRIEGAAWISVGWSWFSMHFVCPAENIFSIDWSEACHLSFALLSAVTPGQHGMFSSSVWSVHRLICECHPCQQTAQKLFKDPKLIQASEPGPTPLQRTKADPCPKSLSVVLGRSSPVWLEQSAPSARFLFTNVSREFICQYKLLSEWVYLGIKSYLEARAMYQSKWQIS